MSRTAALPRVAAPFAWRAQGELVWLSAELDGGQAAFSTRAGGISEGPFESLNLGILTEDEPDRVRHNRATLAHALERDPKTVAMGHQVHGAEIQVQEAVGARDLRQADGQATTTPGVTTLVLVADCVPLVLAAQGAVASVHCGWRGVAAGIVTRAVETLRGLTAQAQVSAAVGPGIGPCCYEVGDEVVARFAERGHAVRGRALDLPGCVAAELRVADVTRIAVAGVCVSCNPQLFFSHRRDGGITGRQAGLAWRAS